MTASRPAHIGFNRSFVLALQALGGSDFDLDSERSFPSRHAEVQQPTLVAFSNSLAIRDAGVVVMGARSECEDLESLPDADGIVALGLDLVLVARMMTSGKLANKVIADIVDRVENKTLAAADVNDALAMIAQVPSARALHRSQIVREVLGFSNEPIARAFQRGLLDGNKMRTLVHRVATGQLDVSDANTGIDALLPQTSGRIAA